MQERLPEPLIRPDRCVMRSRHVFTLQHIQISIHYWRQIILFIKTMWRAVAEADDQPQDLLLVDEQLMLVCATTVQAREPSAVAAVDQKGPGSTTRPDQTRQCLLCEVGAPKGQQRWRRLGLLLWYSKYNVTRLLCWRLWNVSVARRQGGSDWIHRRSGELPPNGRRSSRWFFHIPKYLLQSGYMIVDCLQKFYCDF